MRNDCQSRVVVKDLRTGEESRSEPQCQEPEEPTAILVDHDLGRCADPPTPTSTALWCADNPQDERCAATKPEPTGGQGGSDSDPDRDDDSPRGGTDPSGSDSPQHEASKARTSSGCRYSPAGESSWLGIAAIGLALLGARRRRAAFDRWLANSESRPRLY